MGYLINAWNESQKKFTMTLKQIVNIAGDERLEDEEAVKEMRTFFDLIDLPTLERLLKECYSRDRKLKFDSRGFAFQDLVNEMGKRLGYEVENGLYRGRRNDIGFDGLWWCPDGSCIIMESKATGDYGFSPDTVIGYREKIIEQRDVLKEKCSILLVYGRDDKGTLCNTVKGSDEASNIRLISSNALFQLVKIVCDSKSESVTQQIFQLLRPKDYFVLDNLVELVFPETDDEIEPVDDNNTGNPGSDINIPPLPNRDLKVGKFVFTAMKNLSEAGYIFSDKQISELCADKSMKTVMGMQRALPFLKLYNPDDKNGNCIDGKQRYYKEPLRFGCVTVYVNSQIYKSDREAFIMWYEMLGNEHSAEEITSDTVNSDGKNGIPPLPDRAMKVGQFIHTAMENLSHSGYVFSDDQISDMCSKQWMHDVVGMSRNLPFFKICDQEDKSGTRIDGMVRYYSKPLTFGKHTVYLTKELFSADKEPFILWYENLKPVK